MEFVVAFQVKPDLQVVPYSVLAAILRKVRSGEMVIFPEQLGDLGVKLVDSQEDAVIRFFRDYSEFISSIESYENSENEIRLTIIGGWNTEAACRAFKAMLAELGVSSYELRITS